MNTDDNIKPLPPSSYLDAINEIIQKSFDEAQNAIDVGKISHKTSVYANAVLVNSLMIANAQEKFYGDPNVSFKFNGQGAVILFRNLSDEEYNYDIRLKKCNHKYLTYNSPTARNDKFVTQYSLFDQEPERNTHFNLNAVYKRNSVGTSIETWITYPVGLRSIAWKFQLSNGQVNQDIEPKDSITPSPSQELNRVIPTTERKESINNREKDGTNKS